MPPLDFLCDDLITVQGTPKFNISDKVFDLISFVNEKKRKRNVKIQKMCCLLSSYKLSSIFLVNK